MACLEHIFRAMLQRTWKCACIPSFRPLSLAKKTFWKWILHKTTFVLHLLHKVWCYSVSCRSIFWSTTTWRTSLFRNGFTPMLESLRIHKQPICPSSASFSNYAVISSEVALWGVTWAYLRDGQDGPLQNHAGVITAIFSLVPRPNPFLQVERIALWFISA